MAWLIPENLRRRKDLPGAVKLCADAFSSALGDEVTVWYEPPFDPTGERPDFILLVPQYGVIVLSAVMQMKEEIIGIFRGRLHIVVDGQEKDLPDPFARAIAAMELLNARMKAEIRLRNMRCPVAHGLLLPTLHAEEAERKNFHAIVPKNRIIAQDTLSRVTADKGDTALLRQLRRLFDKPVSRPLAEDQQRILRGIIQPDTIIDGIASGRGIQEVLVFREPEGQADSVRVMDRRQEALAKSLGSGHRVIRGVTGSGKTLILIYRAKLLGRLFPAKRFLVTCYTRSLAAQLRTLLAAHANVEVIHLDRLMWNILKQAGRYPDAAEREDSERVAAFVLKILAEGHGPKYDAVLLDEAQDFGTNCLRVVSSLIASKGADLLIVADAAQNIFNKRFRWKDAGILARGRTTILNQNYRNTREILVFAAAFLAHEIMPKDQKIVEEDEIIAPKAALRSGPLPAVVFVRDYASGIRKTVETVQRYARNSTRPRSIAVSYMVRSIDSYRLADDLYTALVKGGIDVFRLTDPDDPGARDRLYSVNANVILSTVHSLKGLEFPYVVMSGLLHPVMVHTANKKLVYVGMTRATMELTIVSARSNPMVPSLEAALEALEQFRR